MKLKKSLHHSDRQTKRPKLWKISLRKKKRNFLKQQPCFLKKKKTADEISKAVEKILKELAFEKAGFRAEIKPSPLSSSGIDTVEFLFSANPGKR